MTAALEDRISELEERARRFVLATEGEAGWRNYIQSCLLEERDYQNQVLAHTLAMLRNDILDACEATIEKSLQQRIRGTFDPLAKYSANDVVACDGASFIARKDEPGRCPGPHWQMIAAQGKRGIAGPRGERGPPGPVISKWIVDREAFTATPVYDNGIFGPVLELRALFQGEAT